MFEFLLVALILLIVVGIPLTALALGIVALVRSRQLAGRVKRLEMALQGLTGPLPRELEPRGEVVREPVPQPPLEPEPVPLEPILEPARPRGQGRIQWELLVGQKALGWIAVLLLVFAAAFFIRYAFENQWVGPLGRVAAGRLSEWKATIAGSGRFRRR